MLLSRRSFLKTTLLTSVALSSPLLSYAAQSEDYRVSLSAENLKNGFLGYQGIKDNILTLNKNDQLTVAFKNNLEQPTTIHWHGLRIPNEMDGVPYITQDPIKPKEGFNYQFQVPDSGTYFFHPHFNSAEQVERGLKGALIVKEENPPLVDAEHVLVVDDILLGKNGNIIKNFNSTHQAFHDGRIGNVFRLNNQQDINIKAQDGQRLRLRLICATNARIFNLDFNGLPAWLIAKDGQSVGVPIDLTDRKILFGSGQRLDVILDISSNTHKDYSIYSLGEDGQRFPIVHFDIEGTTKNNLTDTPPQTLQANNLPFDINEKNATLIDATLQGGMGGMMDGGGMMNGRNMMNMMMNKRKSAFWSIGGYSMLEDNPKVNDGKAWVFEKGKDYILRMDNQTGYDHPMHMHGHFFKVLNGEDAGLWMDTVMVPAAQSIDILFRAEGIGKWLFHCHILEHAASGMMVWYEVKA